MHLRQLESLKQTGSVLEYQKRFEELAHGILLYNSAFDDIYFVTRFLGGLKEEIRAAIALYRPDDVDTASALALLQEEELSNLKPTTFRSTPKYSAHSERSKNSKPDKVKQQVSKDEGEDKLDTLKAYRRKNALCFRCGEKWGHNHKCPANISLHVMEELWDALEFEIGFCRSYGSYC